jgi:thiopurine S-methyltransferase
MDPSFWHERWEQNQIAFHQPEPNALLRRFWRQICPLSGAPVFVPLCGKSPDLVWLAERGHRVLGIELSPIAVADFFLENGLDPEKSHDGCFERWLTDRYLLLCGDFFALRREDLLDVGAVYDRAALIAFPPAIRRRYVDHLLATLCEGVLICLVTLEYDQGQMDGPPFSVLETEVRELFAEFGDIELLLARDALARSKRFRDRGLSWMTEKIYRLSPKAKNDTNEH